MMNQSASLIAWNQCFPKAAPAGFLCRDVYSDRWLRIHSLPDSKRYAESESERAEILRRHNTVACDVLGEDSECFLFFGCFGQEKHWQDDRNIALNTVRPIHAMTYQHDGDEWQFFSSACHMEAR